jgi:Cu2+-exporting ATPase
VQHGSEKQKSDHTAQGAAMDHAAMGHGSHGHAAMDHSAMGHGDHAAMNHAAMDHGTMDHGDHTAHGAQPTAHGGHQGHQGHSGGHSGHAEIYRQRFWISLLLSIPVVLFSEMVQDWFNYSLPSFRGDNLIAPFFGTIIFIYGGSVFLQGAVDELKSRKPGMMVLISMAIIVAFAASAATSLGWFDLEFWWELALLVTVMLLGHWQEMRAIGQAQGALSALAALLPDEAERIDGDTVQTVPLSALQQGDLLLVRPGARVPADGTIVEGQAEFDESMLTGESRPVDRAPGDRIVAGAIAGGASVRMRVDAVGESTALAGIQRLVEEAQQSRSRAQVLADRFAGILVYVAIISAIITFAAWSIFGTTSEAVERTVTVLVISCPHALGLAIPLVIALSTAIAAKNGMLVKDRLALERMRLVDTVLFDKTGTLTEGSHQLSDIAVANGENADTVLAVAAAVEADSEHPLARAIVRASDDRGLTRPVASNFRANAGRGVEGDVNGAAYSIGGPAMLRERQLTIPAELQASMDAWTARGAAVLNIVRDGGVIGAVALEDQVRPESREAIAELHKQGVKAVMITGDARAVADRVGAELGLDQVLAEVLPEDKERQVIALQERGATVAMVGDGVNDAPALARADVGIAIGAGTDVAIESAGVILATSDPRAVVSVRALSKASYRKMLQNLGWAAGYNLVSIPLAAGVLAPIGIVVNPAIGALLMSASTIIVALNAQLLRGVKLGR